MFSHWALRIERATTLIFTLKVKACSNLILEGGGGGIPCQPVTARGGGVLLQLCPGLGQDRMGVCWVGWLKTQCQRPWKKVFSTPKYMPQIDQRNTLINLRYIYCRD